MRYVKSMIIALSVGAFATFSAPPSNALPAAGAERMTAGENGATLRHDVHGRGVDGPHCRRAWHPRRGWHRHANWCRSGRPPRGWKRANRWRNGCFFFPGGIYCQF